MELEGFENTDIVFITDGECVLSEECFSELHHKQAANNFKITGILLDTKNTINSFSLDSFVSRFIVQAIFWQKALYRKLFLITSDNSLARLNAFDKQNMTIRFSCTTTAHGILYRIAIFPRIVIRHIIIPLIAVRSTVESQRCLTFFIRYDTAIPSTLIQRTLVWGGLITFANEISQYST